MYGQDIPIFGRYDMLYQNYSHIRRVIHLANALENRWAGGFLPGRAGFAGSCQIYLPPYASTALLLHN